MGTIFKSLSLAPKSVRSKLVVAFALMSLLPMFVFGYIIAYYVLPHVDTFAEVYLIFVITILVMLLGFYLAKRIIYPIVEITAHAKGIAEGKLTEDLIVKQEDEIGELSGSLNRLSAKLKENMSDLHSYGEKIKQINMEINKKVFALSGLLQIGNLITTTAPLSEVFNLIVGKLAQLEDGGAAFLMFLDGPSGELIMRAKSNMADDQREEIKIKIGQGALGKVFSNNISLIIDAQRSPKAIDPNLEQILPTKNIAVLPIAASGRTIGILGTGNNTEGFVFTNDALELVGVFAKQVAVAVENDILISKTEALAVRDELTGLYNENYIRGRLDEEIKRAISYQRPCSFIIFEIDNFEQCGDVLGARVAEKILKRTAQTLKMSITDIDKAARFANHQFALLLPEKNKSQAKDLAENIRKEIEGYSLEEEAFKGSVSVTLSAGISATPVDGTTSVELINKVRYLIEKAKSAGKNRVISS